MDFIAIDTTTVFSSGSAFNCKFRCLYVFYTNRICGHHSFTYNSSIHRKKENISFGRTNLQSALALTAYRELRKLKNFTS